MKKLTFLLLLFFGTPGVVWAAQCDEPKITIDAENMGGSDEKDFETALRASIVKVCKWWGPTFAGPFKINIEDNRGPSKALTPGWRGNRGAMLFRTRTTRAGLSVITHEVVHVFAPNGNRFLAEGFAVYAQERFEGHKGYPTFGKELHQAAKKFLRKADLSAMDRRATPKGLRTDDLSTKSAYIAAGSFIKFLIATHGMEKIRCLYELTPMVPRVAKQSGAPDRWQDIYGVDLKTLEKSWKAMVASR